MDDPDSFYKAFGRRVKDARCRRRPAMTQDDLAGLVGLTRTSVTNIERGRQRCLLHTVFDLAKALNVDPISLIPPTSETVDLLGQILDTRSSVEKEWIMSAVAAANQAEKSHGA